MAEAVGIEDSSSVSSNHTKKVRILLTFLPIRKKYLSALGGMKAIALFDVILDATGIVAIDKGVEVYEDEISSAKIKKVNSSESALAVLEAEEMENVDFCLVFRPRTDVTSLEVIDLVTARSNSWALLANKVTLRDTFSILYPTNYLRILKFSLEARRSKSARERRPDVLFTNSIVANKNLLRHFRPRKTIYVPHMDSRRRPDKSSCDIRFGVFLDQYLPFHSEFQNVHGIKIDARQYYSELSEFFAFAKTEFDLDDILFCCHPNSQGEELPYLRYCRPSYGDSAERCADASVVFGHYSNSLSFAEQLGKPIVLVHLGAGESHLRGPR